MKNSKAIQLKNITKKYPGTLAVDNVDFEVEYGKVHALVGENGAGKSTLMKVIAGSFDDYEGDIIIDGKEVDLHTPAIAKKHGIGMVYQELSLAEPISIAENILAGRLPVKYGFVIDKKSMINHAKESLSKVGLDDLDPLKKVEDISQHKRQLVEIAKTLDSNPKILVLDEPTSALSRKEVDLLFDIITKLKKRDMAIIYISHHLSEIFQVADRASVMRDAKMVFNNKVDEVTKEQLIQKMVGRNVDELRCDKKGEIGETKLEVINLTRHGFFHDVSFSVNEGEILAVAGLTGSGRTELAKSICGIDPLDEGEIKLNDEEITSVSFPKKLDKGIGYLSENRQSEGLFLRLSMEQNLKCTSIPENCKYDIYYCGINNLSIENLINELEIVPKDPKIELKNFSGGNQQKVLLGKWLATDPQLLILDEPTRGVDIGAKEIIHDTIVDLACNGVAIILITSDLPELVKLADRAVIMYKGRKSGELTKTQIDEENILLAINSEKGEKLNVS